MKRETNTLSGSGSEMTDYYRGIIVVDLHLLGPYFTLLGLNMICMSGMSGKLKCDLFPDFIYRVPRFCLMLNAS